MVHECICAHVVDIVVASHLIVEFGECVNFCWEFPVIAYRCGNELFIVRPVKHLDSVLSSIFFHLRRACMQNWRILKASAEIEMIFLALNSSFFSYDIPNY